MSLICHTFTSFPDKFGTSKSQIGKASTRFGRNQTEFAKIKK